jgi:hypothetical protein
MQQSFNGSGVDTANVPQSFGSKTEKLALPIVFSRTAPAMEKSPQPPSHRVQLRQPGIERLQPLVRAVIQPDVLFLVAIPQSEGGSYRYIGRSDFG